MVLTKWIVPEPDPKLRLTLDQIDISVLDFEDVSWICSSAMKQHRDEFNELHGFIDRTVMLVLENKKRLPKKRNQYIYPTIVKGYHIKEPTICPDDPDHSIKFKTNKSLPFNRIPFLKRFGRKKSEIRSPEVYVI
jgi:hypothetical protein